jgi:hypothetical protein
MLRLVTFYASHTFSFAKFNYLSNYLTTNYFLSSFPLNSKIIFIESFLFTIYFKNMANRRGTWKKLVAFTA